MNPKYLKIALWIVRVLLAAGFLLASSGKITNNPAVIEMFHNWGYPAEFGMVIGILEFTGAILILIPKTSVYASYGLIVIMLGALVTHILHDPIANVLRPGIFLILIALNLYMTKSLKSSDSVKASSF